MAALIRFADGVPVPWKNGGGSTRELWREADEAGGVLARISAAEISGRQAFSSFPGFDRLILQLAGPQVQLEIDGRAVAMLPSAPIAFRGEAQVVSQVQGQALDLNLMARRDHFRSEMQVVAALPGQAVVATPPLARLMVLALEPVALAGALGAELARHDLVVLRPGEGVEVKQAARLVVMALHLAGPA